MLDKQIIIDGVDVSECENFSCGICEQENKIPRTINHFTVDCRMYPNCHYKLYKRKAQECERLKEEVSLLKESNSKLQQIEDVNSLEKCYLQQLDKLKQTIAEIKEITENMNKECFYDDFDCMNCDMQNGCTYFNKKQILQKISECEVKNEI